MRATINVKTTIHLLCFGTALAIVSSSSRAGDDVLYDALLRDVGTKDRPYEDGNDRAGGFIGGTNIIGEPWDRQSTDDFELSATSTITSITIDTGSFLGTPPPTYLIEFFEDENGTPSEITFASTTVPADNISVIATFICVQCGQTGNEPGYRLALDLGDGATLGAGTWWVSVVAVDEDDWNYAVFRQYERATGGVVHFRSGGMDHGNGYSDFYEVWDWTPLGTVIGAPLEGDLAMRIEGVPAGDCPADLTGDGELNFFDVSAFLNAFTAMDPAADFDGNGEFNFFDVSAFLNAFTAGCP